MGASGRKAEIIPHHEQPGYPLLSLSDAGEIQFTACATENIGAEAFVSYIDAWLSNMPSGEVWKLMKDTCNSKHLFVTYDTSLIGESNALRYQHAV